MRLLPSLTDALGLSLSTKVRTLRSTPGDCRRSRRKSQCLQELKLVETMEGEVLFSAQGSVPMTGRLHGVSRIYTTSASRSEIIDAINEVSDAVRSFPGLVRYTVAKLTDGRIAIFNSFDSQENARKSSEEAKGLRAKSGSKLARVLPSDPEILEGTVIGTYPRSGVTDITRYHRRGAAVMPPYDAND